MQTYYKIYPLVLHDWVERSAIINPSRFLNTVNTTQHGERA